MNKRRRLMVFGILVFLTLAFIVAFFLQAQSNGGDVIMDGLLILALLAVLGAILRWGFRMLRQ
ncbi:MAG: hypothetical protein WCD86_10160 [Ktedonobacteraceae bacterium]